MNRLGLLFALLIALLAGSGALAQSSGRRMDVRLVAETASVAPGSTVALAFVMRPRSGWHGYWRNPGDAGAEPRVQWWLPGGWRAGPLQYPVPDRLIVAGLMNYVFERDYALLATVSVPADAEPGGTFPVEPGSTIWFAPTRSACPRQASVPTELAVGAAREPDPAFGAYRQALPRPLAARGQFEVAGGRLRLAIPFRRPRRFPSPISSPRRARPSAIPNHRRHRAAATR